MFALVVLLLVSPSALALSRREFCSLPQLQELCDEVCVAPDYSAEPAALDTSSCSSRYCETPLCEADATPTTKILEKFFGHHNPQEIIHLGQDLDSNSKKIYTCSRQNISMTIDHNGRALYAEYFLNDSNTNEYYDLWTYRELCSGALENWWLDPNGSPCNLQHWERRVFHPNYDVMTGQKIGNDKVKFWVAEECRLDLRISTIRFIKVCSLSHITSHVKQWITDNIPGLDVDAALSACKAAGIY